MSLIDIPGVDFCEALLYRPATILDPRYFRILAIEHNADHLGWLISNISNLQVDLNDEHPEGAPCLKLHYHFHVTSLDLEMVREKITELNPDLVIINARPDDVFGSQDIMLYSEELLVKGRMVFLAPKEVWEARPRLHKFPFMYEFSQEIFTHIQRILSCEEAVM